MKVASTILGKMFFELADFQPTILNTNDSIVFAILPIVLVALFAAQILVSSCLVDDPACMLPGFNTVVYLLPVLTK